MRNVISLLFILILGLIISASSRAQSVTITGTVKDSITQLPIDSATVVLVNERNPTERYSVITDASGNWSYMFQSTGVIARTDIPTNLVLGQNYPNPFNPSTKIEFSLQTPGTARITVYNILGQLLDEGSFSLTAGYYSIDWRSKGGSGVLFYSIEINGTRIARKMIQLDGGSTAGGLGNLASAHSIAALPAMQKVAAQEFSVIASKFGYEVDTIGIVLVDNLHVDFVLATVHSRAFLIDLHNDILEAMVDGYDFGVRHSSNQTDLPRYRDGGYDAQMFPVWIDPGILNGAYYAAAIAMMDTFSYQVSRYSSAVAQARTIDEINQIHASGRMVGILCVEGGHHIENDLEKLKALYTRGARYMTITWNNSTSWATAAADPLTATVGLSDFGKQVIKTMDSLGMIIDVAHTGIKTIQDILATTKNPIIDSHCGVYALRPHYRNLTDSQIVSIAKSGGVMGVIYDAGFLSTAVAWRDVTIDTLIKHIDYIKNLVGIDYVALGSDFDGGIKPVVGLADVSKLPALTLALLKHGYSPADVRKILGENYLRVFKQICH